MKKTILIGLAILAVSTSGAFAAKKMKKEAAPAATSSQPMMMGQVSAADKALYMKNMHDSGMKMKK